MPHLLSLQVAKSRRFLIDGRPVLTAFQKIPVAASARIEPLGVAGDEQADLSVHGGLEKAIYAYPSEHYPFWRNERAERGLSAIDDALPWGSLGENLTLQGLLEADVWVGDVLRFAHCSLRVTQPREPCYKLNAVMGFNGASRAMAKTGCCGFYLAVEQTGEVQAGESFDLVPGPRRLSIAERFNARMVKHLR